MGAWGAGLYSDDYALDLRATVAGVARLPLADDEVLAMLRSHDPVADDPESEDYTTFWLVAADQLARRGCYPEEARRRALEIIASGADLKTTAELGATPAVLRKRRAMLDDLERVLRNPAPRARTTLAGPQAFTFALGEVFAFPTSRGRALNPYFKSRELMPDWSQDGWRAAVVVEADRAFGHLAWFRVMTAGKAWRDKPTMADIWAARDWTLYAPATCSPVRRERLAVQTLGYVEIKSVELERRRGGLQGGAFRTVQSATLGDICISNDLIVQPSAAPSWPWARSPRLVRRLAMLASPARAR
jgi:hypothetical protein